MACSYDYVDSPLGPLLVVGRDDALERIGLPAGRRRVAPAADWVREAAPFRECRRQLDEYFKGERRAFDLPLAPRGTPFQLEVWTALAAIAFGTTVSYRDLAQRIGRPTAMRAVGLANGRNPLPILLPCHRVIGSDGSLVGYGGGLEAKRFLLVLENAIPGGLWEGARQRHFTRATQASR